MAKYLFVLGRDIELSKAELSVKLNEKPIYHEDNYLIFEMNSFDVNIKDFSGLVKIGKEISFNDIEFNQDKIKLVTNSGELTAFFKDKCKEYRIKYTISAVDSLDIKQGDLEILEVNGLYFRIIQVTNTKEYKLRDENRPKFDEKKVISIRLAGILLNLSKAEKEVLDPFCGTGTILQEALLKGLNAYGSDLRIEDAKENLEWLKKKFNVKGRYSLFQDDVKNLSRHLKSVECIVSEPDLGPYWTKYPSKQEAQKALDTLKITYENFLREASKIVRKRIVFLTPISKTNDKKEARLDFESLAKKYGFIPVIHPIKYSLKRSFIIREIWVLIRQK